MHKHSFKKLLKNPVWTRVMGLSIALFFIYFSDAILSFWIPGFMQNALGSALLMGLIMSFSSIIGLTADILFPQLFRKASVRRMISYAIITSLLFSVLLLIATWQPIVLILLLGMALWGIYYEFLSFSKQEFVADVVPLKQRASAWGLISAFRDLAYFLGPFVAVYLISFGNQFVVLLSFVITIIAYFMFMLLKFRKSSLRLKVEKVNILKELRHWRTLIARVWPIIIISIIIGLIDATFWTVGAVWSEKLAETEPLGGFFLSLYTLPALFMGLILIKMGIYTQKKRLTVLFLFITGLMLVLLGLNNDVGWQLLAVFVIGMMVALSFPLTDAVYSDILARMGKEQKHLIGLSSSTVSIAYIFGPTIAGLISSFVGELLTFTYVGVAVLITSIILLIFTPKKIKLPQTEIKKWD